MIDVTGLTLRVGPHGPHGPTGPHGPMGSSGSGGWGTMWGVAGDGTALVPLLLWIAFALAIVVTAVYLVGRLVDRAPGGADARTVLETRYARGEIDDEEFERRRDRLAVEP